MARRPNKKHLAWYEETRASYVSLANMVAATVRTLLQNERIDIIDVTHRVKTSSSFLEKIRRKRYADPKAELTDLAGIRIITLIERDIEKVSALIEKSFNVYPEFSVNKSDDLGPDKFGYRSVHFVCDIGGIREALPEFSPYAGMKFEIQVRTALQHAWAEIEHDRSYKFSGELPSKFKRRFHLIAGLLELADREFSTLTEELENYSEQVQVQAESGNLDIELNSTSVLEFIKVTLAKYPDGPVVGAGQVDQEVIAELRRFGIDAFSKLVELLSAEFMTAEQKVETTPIGLLRDAMIFQDIDRYFGVAWKESWQGWDEDSLLVMTQRYGRDKVKEIMGEYSLDFLPSDPSEDGWGLDGSDNENIDKAGE